jgi:hypothetical protein
MKKVNFHFSHLQILYLVIYVVLFSLIVYIPKLISGPVYITEKFFVEEEIIEGALIAVLFILNILILNLYNKETLRQKELIKKINSEKEKAKEKLDDSSKYIGQINVQIQEIKSIFNNSYKLPETKNDFKKALLFFCNRVFGITKTDWVLFRIINTNTHKTLIEQLGSRQGFSTEYPHISNKEIIEKQSLSPYTVVICNPQNLSILTYCILPVEKITNDERVFIQAITNEINMLFLILNSPYYKKQENVHTGDSNVA